MTTEDKEGWVYCISNESMPGLLKIGMTDRTPQQRLAEANKSDTWRPPTNFAIYRSLIGDDSDNIPGVPGLGTKTIFERFPKFTQEAMNLDEFYKYAQEVSVGSKVKIYNKVLEAEANVRLYFEVIQLGTSDINMSNKMKIIGMMEKPVEKLTKIKFHTMLIEDGMTSAIKNTEMWLREVTSKLDKHTLED